MVFDGTTATNATSTASQNATDLISFSITSKGGAITASVGVFFGSSITYILFDEDVAEGEAYIYLGNPIRILPEYKIFISVSGGTADYYFTIL